MRPTELYNSLLASESSSITVHCDRTLVAAIKSRLSQAKHRQQRGLGEFADNSSRLSYTVLPNPNGADESKVMLRIDLVATEAELDIDAVTVSGEF